MYNEIFGKIEYDFVWEGCSSIRIYNQEYRVKITIEDEEEEGVKKIQEESYIEFKKREKEMCDEMQHCIYKYYIELCEKGEEIDDDFKSKSSTINCYKDLKDFVTPTHICIQEFDKNREIIFLFKCEWNHDLGIGIKFVNEKITKIGIQSEVLI